jgi:hypothetical protein
VFLSLSLSPDIGSTNDKYIAESRGRCTGERNILPCAGQRLWLRSLKFSNHIHVSHDKLTLIRSQFEKQSGHLKALVKPRLVARGSRDVTDDLRGVIVGELGVRHEELAVHFGHGKGRLGRREDLLLCRRARTTR